MINNQYHASDSLLSEVEDFLLHAVDVLSAAPASSNDYYAFEKLLLDSSNAPGTSTLFVCAWLAVSDGPVNKSETERLAIISAGSGHFHDVDKLLSLARSRELRALQLACEILRTHYTGSNARLFLQLAIGVALSDGALKPAENAILRFLSDVLHIEPCELYSLFRTIAGRALPSLPDMSSATYWHTAPNDEYVPHRSRRSSPRYDTHHSATRHRRARRDLSDAYMILGLKIDATEADIRRAYRRLAQLHHPDRYSPLGPEAVAMATTTFQRIHDARKLLLRYA